MRHTAEFHQKVQLSRYNCIMCKKKFKTKSDYEKHNREVHAIDKDFNKFNSALRGYVENYRKVIMKGPHLNILLHDEYLIPLINFLENQRAIRATYKIGLVCIASFDTVVDTEASEGSSRHTGDTDN